MYISKGMFKKQARLVVGWSHFLATNKYTKLKVGGGALQ